MGSEKTEQVDFVFANLIKAYIRTYNIDLDSFRDRFESEQEFHNVKKIIEERLQMSESLFFDVCNKLDIGWSIRLSPKKKPVLQ